MFDLRATPTFEFLPASAILHPIPVQFLIDQYFEKDAVALLFAKPGMGKSFLALSWSACIATGTPWDGVSVTQGAVFYIAGEGNSGLRRRLRAWEMHTGVSLQKAPLYVSTCPAQLLNEQSAMAVVSSIEQLAAQHGSPALIVIDTFARNMGAGDENSNADVSQFVSHIDQIKAHFKCAVLIVHHSGHAETNRARGGSGLPAAMDSIFRMDGKSGGTELTLTHVKSKESELREPVALTLKPVTLVGWKDAMGRDLGSAVLVRKPGAASANTLLANSLGAQAKLAIEVYRKMEDQQAAVAGASPVRGISEASWREEFFADSGAPTDEAKRKAFGRAKNELQRAGILHSKGNQLLLTGASTGSNQIEGHPESYAADK